MWRWCGLSAALAVVLSCPTIGCSDGGGSSRRIPRQRDTDTGGTPSTASWTLLVYMLGDNNLEPFSLLDLVEMTAAGQSDEVNIIVQLDRTHGYTDVWGNWTTVKRFRVAKEDVVELADLGEEDLGDPAVLEDFIAWGVAHFPAESTPDSYSGITAPGGSVTGVMLR